MKLCSAVAGAIGLTYLPPVKLAGASSKLGRSYRPADLVAKALSTKSRLPVIWLEFQDCAGCSEALTRSQAPTLVDLVLNQITVEYHETLSAAAGFQAEEAKQSAMQKYAGQYILVVEGSISPKDDGVYCTIGGKSSLDLLKDAAANAAAIIATGNCAAFGGLPKANPNPTGAVSVSEIIKDKPVVNIPGCHAIPEVFTSAAREPLPTMPALPSNGLAGFPSQFNLVTPAWAVLNPTSGMAAASIKVSLPPWIGPLPSRLALLWQPALSLEQVSPPLIMVRRIKLNMNQPKKPNRGEEDELD